ncbi:MAG: virulence RhuM family protein [Oscillospiraceae bacterium]|nr:virulence RhuM family protein [Oscillospiraceae bacterium]
MSEDIKESEILMYETEEGKVSIEVILRDENIWLNQKRIAKLFDVEQPDISKHLTNIYNEGELIKNSTYSKMELVQEEGNRKVKRSIEVYNLDAIIAVGYRVNSKKATQFRIWATKVLKDYIVQGFVLNEDRFMKARKGDQQYFDRLLEKIKLIRTSERMAYQKITDIFVDCSIDYDKKSEEAYMFFKIVQNKLHYAITGKTAAELIYERVDANKINMGLTTWEEAPNGKILKYDISVAKNYLVKKELEKLNDLTEMFLIVAETEAKEQRIMMMQDWINVTDDLLKYRKKAVLSDAGSISHKEAVKKASKEYEKFRIKQDQEYISSMDELYKKYLKESKK